MKFNRRLTEKEAGGKRDNLFPYYYSPIARLMFVVVTRAFHSRLTRSIQSKDCTL